MEKNVSQRMTTLSFIMSCFIVLYHCGPTEMESVNLIDKSIDAFFNNFFTSFGDLAMCYFFTVSGYLFFYNYHEGVYLKKIRKRFTTLFIPYFLWNTITGIMWLYEKHWDLYIKNNFLLEQWPYDFPLWYMYVIFLLSFISPIFYWMFKDRRLGAGAVVICMFLFYCIQISQNHMVITVRSYGLMPELITYLPVYFIGAYFGIQKMSNEDIIRFVSLILLIVVIGSSVWSDFLRINVVRIIPILLIYSLPKMFLIKNAKTTNITFLLYATHAFTDGARRVIRPVMAELCSWSSWINVGGRVLTLMYCLMVAWIVWIVMSKVTPNILRIVTGNRVKAEI